MEFGLYLNQVYFSSFKTLRHFVEVHIRRRTSDAEHFDENFAVSAGIRHVTSVER